jgi:hypothetical protein
MSKKDFGASLRKTRTTQQKAIEDRFAVADSTLLSGKAPEVTPAPAAASGTVEKSALPPSDSAKGGTLVTRDTFSMPAGDYGLIAQLRVRAAREGRNTNKSEVVRAGLHSLMALEPSNLVEILDELEKVKPGRK